MKQRFRTPCFTCHRSAAMMQHWVEMTEHDILSTLYNKPTTTPIANVIGYDVNVICGSVCTDWPCANSTKQRVLFLRAALVRITLGRRDDLFQEFYTVQPAEFSATGGAKGESFIDSIYAVTGGVCHSTPALWGWGLFPIGYFHVRLWYKGLCSIEPYLYYFNKGEDRSLIYWISYSNSPWSIYFTSSLPLVFATNWRLVTGYGSSCHCSAVHNNTITLHLQVGIATIDSLMGCEGNN